MYDDKKFLVFVDPTHLAAVIKSRRGDAEADDELVESLGTLAMESIASWAREHQGEVHFTRKAGRRSPRRLYRVAFTDGDQAAALAALDQELNAIIRKITHSSAATDGSS